MESSENKRDIKILLVEDNEINAFVLSKFLKDFTLLHATNGKEVLNLLENHKVTLVLMDINLGDPEMDGIQVLKEIRKNPEYGHTKVYAVTSYALKGDRERFLEDGFDDYMSKPIDRLALIEKIEEILNQEQSQ
jgi:two-component system, sensor histidine kinase